MRLCIAEDKAASALEPLSLTRPVFELLLGGGTIGSKIARAFGVRTDSARCGMVVRPYLEALQRLRAPLAAVNDQVWLSGGATVVANGRWVPPHRFIIPSDDLPWIGTCDGLPACALVGPDMAALLEPNGVDDWFVRVSAKVRSRDLGGEWIRHPWDLVAKNSEHLIRDFEATPRIAPTPHHLSSSALVGPPGRLSIDETARIDPYTVLDTTLGPITISEGVTVQPFTRIEGPCYIGPRTQLFRTNLRHGVTLGPECRIGGEVEESIVHGYTNKYHEGFLGHSYVGEWVNLGAITSSADVRNDYSHVRVAIGGETVTSGQSKVGCFLGDYTRTGLGCLLNAGTTVGVMCNLLPAGRLLPKHVPSFTAVLHGRMAPNFPRDRLFETARIVMGRRLRDFSAVEEQVLVDLFEQTRFERERILQMSSEVRDDRPSVSVAMVGL